MNDAHVAAWLGAYYDGELPEARRQQVEEHLSGCPTCRAELEELRKLSSLLQEAPAPERMLAAQNFNAQVKLRLPRTAPARPAWQTALKAGWQLAPLGAVFLWVFAQAALIVAGLASVLNLPVSLGLGAELSGWTILANSLLGIRGSEATAETIIVLVLLNLAFTALVAVFLCGWIASWWVFRRQAQKETDQLAA